MNGEKCQWTRRVIGWAGLLILGCGGFWSANAQPVIVQQPESVTVTSGHIVRLEVQAIGNSRLRYRWIFNDRYVSTRSRVLKFRGYVRRSGVFRVLVMDRSGQYTFSQPVVVTVNPRTPAPAPAPAPVRGSAPVILDQPDDVTVYEHDTAVFNVRVSSALPLTTIIWHNDNPMEGSHQIPDGLGFDVRSTRLAIPNSLNADNYNGLYWLAVTNAAGGTVTRKARLTVVPRPN